jgi:hypothetical protein
MNIVTARPNWIRVLIHGLFVCAFKQEEEKPPILEVAALKEPTPKHQLNLHKFNREVIDAEHKIIIGHDDIVQLKISDAAGVIRYQQPNEFKFRPEDDRRDFRWLIDFENELFNSECASQNTGFRFEVNDGLAYTMIRSIPLHRITDNGNPEEWRRVALVMAVDIDYRHGRVARLFNKQGDIISEFEASTRYNLALRNDCEGVPCHEPSHPNANTGTDLNELFQAVVKPVNKPDFKIIRSGLPLWVEDLILDEEIMGTGGIDGPASKQLRGLTKIFKPSGNRDTARHPCGPAFFGKSNGLSGG